jgi:hypothetical protein
MAKVFDVYKSEFSGAPTGRDVDPEKEAFVQGDGSSSKGKFSPLEPRLFVVREGKRYPVTDFRSFRQAGFDLSAIKVISEPASRSF